MAGSAGRYRAAPRLVAASGGGRGLALWGRKHSRTSRSPGEGHGLVLRGRHHSRYSRDPRNPVTL